jgi:hypothetical protein
MGMLGKDRVVVMLWGGAFGLFENGISVLVSGGGL